MSKEISKEKTNSLLNCPFCGGELAIRKWVGFDGESFSLKCNTDGCVLSVDSFRDKEELIRKANARKPMQNIVERLGNKHNESTINYHNLKDASCLGERHAYRNAIEIVKEEGGMHDNT